MYYHYYCRKADELKSVRDLGLSEETYEIVRGIEPEQLICTVRNRRLINVVYEAMDEFGSYHERKKKVHRIVREIEDKMQEAGYLRDVDGSVEFRFLKMVNKHSKKDGDHPCRELTRIWDDHFFQMNGLGPMHLWFSNEFYENYDFNARGRMLLDILREVLSPAQFRLVEYCSVHDVDDRFYAREEEALNGVRETLARKQKVLSALIVKRVPTN